jgi:hypothetical protein
VVDNYHADAIVYESIAPQEGLCLKIPSEYLRRFIDILKIHINGIDPELVLNPDETGNSDWVGRRIYSAFAARTWARAICIFQSAEVSNIKA